MKVIALFAMFVAVASAFDCSQHDGDVDACIKTNHVDDENQYCKYTILTACECISGTTSGDHDDCAAVETFAEASDVIDGSNAWLEGATCDENGCDGAEDSVKSATGVTVELGPYECKVVELTWVAPGAMPADDSAYPNGYQAYFYADVTAVNDVDGAALGNGHEVEVAARSNDVDYTHPYVGDANTAGGSNPVNWCHTNLCDLTEDAFGQCETEDPRFNAAYDGTPEGEFGAVPFPFQHGDFNSERECKFTEDLVNQVWVLNKGSASVDIKLVNFGYDTWCRFGDEVAAALAGLGAALMGFVVAVVVAVLLCLYCCCCRRSKTVVVVQQAE